MDSNRVASLLDRIASCLPEGRTVGALHEPLFAGNEKAYLSECIDTTLVSSVGPFVDRFERELERITGASKAVAVVNGTAALHLGLMLAGVKPGDEVLVPAMTFVATANAVSHCGAIPHFVEVSPTTLGLDPASLRAYLTEIGKRSEKGFLNRRSGKFIRACVPMHTFGFPVNMEPLLSLCEELGIQVVEDAAEALGSYWHGKHAGTFAPIGVLSFNGNKIVTTGGGGALLFRDVKLGERAKHLSTTAKKPHPYAFEHDAIGYNYRMPNLNAALGVAQLERLEILLAAKRRLAQRYQQAFQGDSKAVFLSEPSGSQSNYWLCSLALRGVQDGARDAVLEAAVARKIPLRPPWKILYELPIYAQAQRMPCPVAEGLAASLIQLPSGPALAPEAV